MQGGLSSSDNPSTAVLLSTNTSPQQNLLYEDDKLHLQVGSLLSSLAEATTCTELFQQPLHVWLQLWPLHIPTMQMHEAPVIIQVLVIAKHS